ncbi:MAG: hypothetical protein V3V05_12035 [Pontiella sp.]
MVALAGFLTQYVGMISSCVGSAVGRYINVALNRNDWDQANEIFSTAILSNIVLILLQLPIHVLCIWKLNWLIDVPDSLLNDFRILVGCNVLIFLVSTLTGVFITSLYAANRLDITAKVDVVRLILRVIVLLTLILQYGAKLWIIGAVDLGLCLVATTVECIYAYRFARQLKFRLASVTKKWIKPVLDMAGWSLISVLGFSLFVKTDVWMINRFVSKELAGVYAVLLVWPNFIKQFGGMIGGLIAPVFTIDFAKGNFSRMRQACLLSSQVLSYGTAYVCGVFIVASSGLIRLWLDDSYVEYTLWVQLMVGQLAFTISGSIIWHMFVAVGKTKYMGIGNLIPGILNILLSLFLIYMGYGALGVLLGTMVAVFLKENILFPIWVSKEAGIPYRKFMFIYIRSGLVMGLVFGIGYLIMPFSAEFSFIALIAVALATFGPALLLIYIMTNRSERAAIYQFVRMKLLKQNITS